MSNGPFPRVSVLRGEDVSHQAAGDPRPDIGGADTFTGTVTVSYTPDVNGAANPGEVVWAWVAYEETRRIGKDRPILVIGHAGRSRLAALMLSSQDHAGDRGWTLLGRGPWDREGRASWVRTDRVLAVPAPAVRREGAVVPPRAFDEVIARVTGARLVRRTTLLRRLLRLVRPGRSTAPR